ncbi:MAG: hypothetical protein ACREB2_08980, partial [Pseudolabrys sp.]
MSCAAATFPNVTVFDRRPSGELRRFLAAGAFLGLSTLVAAGAIAVVTVAAAGLMAGTFSGHGSIQTKAALGRSTIALAGPYPKLAGTTEFAGLTQTTGGPGYAPPVAVATNMPALREARLEPARAPDLTHVAELAAPAAPAVIPLPPRCAVERPP